MCYYKKVLNSRSAVCRIIVPFVTSIARKGCTTLESNPYKTFPNGVVCYVFNTTIN